MILLRLKVRCRPERIQQALGVFTAVVEPSRGVDGVVRFDVGRDLSDAETFVAVGVFDDDDARERQEALPQVATLMRMLPELAVEVPEVTRFEVASATPPL